MKKADDYLLYLSGVISENQYHEGTNEEPAKDEAMELPEFKKLMAKLTNRLGEKSNKYVPLLKYVARNKNMLPMFEELIEDVSKLQASVGKRVFK